MELIFIFKAFKCPFFTLRQNSSSTNHFKIPHFIELVFSYSKAFKNGKDVFLHLVQYR
jgi:hypothetical protein